MADPSKTLPKSTVDRAQPSTASVLRTVEWVDTDASGHQHNSAVIRWVEAAEAKLFRELELPEYFPSAPRVQQVVNFTSKLWFGQQVTATATVQRLGRTSLTLAFEVVGHAHEQRPETVAAHGTIVVAHVPAGAASARPWPDAVRAAVSPAEGGPR